MLISSDYRALGLHNRGTVFALSMVNCNNLWAATTADGGFQFIEDACGNVLAAPATVPGTELVAKSGDTGQPNSVWTATKGDSIEPLSSIELGAMLQLAIGIDGKAPGRLEDTLFVCITDDNRVVLQPIRSRKPALFRYAGPPTA